MYRWVSLGSWCGPSLLLSKLNLRPTSQLVPFDSARCSLDGIIHFAHHGFHEGFFPGPINSRPWTPLPSGIWLLFRGLHSCFTHFNLNKQVHIDTFLNYIQEWENIFQNPTQDVIFIRTCLSEDPCEEVKLLPILHEAFRYKSQQKLNFRTALIFHDNSLQSSASPSPMASMGKEAILFRLPLISPELSSANSEKSPSLLDRTSYGYEVIFRWIQSESWWHKTCLSLPPLIPNFLPNTSQSSLITSSRELCQVGNFSALQGSCKGVNSTLYRISGNSCIYCGDRNGHQRSLILNPELQDNLNVSRPWTNDEIQLVNASFSIEGLDYVQLVEKLALCLNREAWDILEFVKRKKIITD